MKKKLYTFQDFSEEYGIEVWEYLHYKALQGDSSDNIPGLKGIGPKKALQIIKRSEWKVTYEGFRDVLDRNIQLMELPFHGCPEVEWSLNQPDQLKFEKAVDRHNLEWFLTPPGLRCADRFFTEYRRQKVKKSIKIRRRA